jgi:hypothetical protein
VRPFVVVVALLLVLIVTVNGVAVWERARHEVRLERAAAVFSPGQALLGYRDTDERRFQKARLAVIPKPRIVIFGSSRVMTISSQMLGAAPGEFYNAGLSGGTVEDFIVLWSTLKAGGKLPEVAVCQFDNWEFNASHPQVRWLVWADDVSRFVETTEGARGWQGAAPLLYRWYQLKDLLSYSVLKRSFGDLQRVRRHREPRGAELLQSLSDQLVDERQIDGRRALRADGSLVYEAAYEGRTVDEARADALDFVRLHHANLRAFTWDAERARRLDLLWRDMRAHGVRIVAYLAPLHPVVWDSVRRDDGAMAGLARTHAALAALAGPQAKVHDLSDPASVSCTESDFLDGTHVRAACLTRVLARAGVAAQTTGAR